MTLTMEERDAERRRMHREFMRAQKAAPARARELLAACLSAEQFASYVARLHFVVTASSGEQWEIWDAGVSGNVVRRPRDGHKHYERYCIHPPCGEFREFRYYLADADAHLAQALALAAGERAFLRTAHIMERTPYHPYNRWRKD
jgi:hypothetical protein